MHETANTAGQRPVLDVLERAHALLNEALFFGACSREVVLSVPARGRRVGDGAFAPASWRRGTAQPAEIAIFGEGLDRPFREVLVTLLIQMVRQANAEAGVADASRGGAYLNRAFRDVAQAVGLAVALRGPGKGWIATGLDPTLAWAEAVVECIDHTLAPGFDLVRTLHRPAAGTGRMRLFICGCVPAVKVRTGRRALPWRCVECGEVAREVKRAG